MHTRNTKYQPIQIRTGHYEEFKRLCEKESLHQVDAFGEALMAWKHQISRRGK